MAATAGSSPACSPPPLHDRKENFENASLVDPAFHRDKTLALFYNAVTCRQAQPRAAATGFVVKKRLEDLPDHMPGIPTPVSATLMRT